MPSPEHRPSPEPDHDRYQRAARFAGEQSAGQVYQQLQELLYRSPTADLSVFRLQLDRVYHVAALGQPPPPTIARRLEALLAAGERVTLPTDVVEALWERRRQAARLGPWVERHHRR
jgi:hypothetical protein